ncbi:hypothetical protein [Clostridium sp. AF02-29]|uniref:hypothetical protein n=1 Tax=Clostridium sp. AF02-29 TaxID=2292993 RepID=UPI0030811ECA
MRKKFPMNLQLFAEPGNPTPPEPQPTPPEPQPTPPTIDYGKIQQMLDGTLAAKEDTALKAYFKQQGLSQEEVEQAIAAFKAEKAKNQPDVGAMQSQLAKAQTAAQEAQIQVPECWRQLNWGLILKRFHMF